MAMVDVHWYECKYVLQYPRFALHIGCGESSVWAEERFYPYPAWASALLVLTELGNARASESWDEQHVQTPTSFF